VERHPEKLSEGVVRRNGEVTPWNAGDAVAATVDFCRTRGIPLAPSIRARLGKAAKALLESDFPPNVVVASCVVAIRTGWFGSVETIAQEMAVAQAGERMTRQAYVQAMHETSREMEHSESEVWKTLREETQRRAEKSKGAEA
jgi:hypothetical protein